MIKKLICTRMNYWELYHGFPIFPLKKCFRIKFLFVLCNGFVWEDTKLEPLLLATGSHSWCTSQIYMCLKNVWLGARQNCKGLWCLTNKMLDKMLAYLWVMCLIEYYLVMSFMLDRMLVILELCALTRIV